MRPQSRVPAIIRMTSLAVIIALSMSLAGLPAPVAQASTYTVDTTANTPDAAPGDGFCADSNADCSLRAAIEESNAGGGPDTIVLQAGQTYTFSSADLDPLGYGPNALPRITTVITIEGNGATLTSDRAVPFRFFFIDLYGVLTLRYLTLSNGWSQGGDGGSGNGGGGGGAGLGGAIYNRYTLIMEGVTLTGNLAQGSAGGSGAAPGGGGGGGGLGGDGAAAPPPPSGGGGGGTLFPGSGSSGGAANGGSGGTLDGQTGANAGGDGGGGGGGAAGAVNPGGAGGDGGFGGGGGGGAHGNGSDGNGGKGGIVGLAVGFGGGGGGGGGGSLNPGSGGVGGLGAGNGGAGAAAGNGGGGGGGLGGGGAIINHEGVIQMTNCTLSGNTAQGGQGGNSGNVLPSGTGGDGGSAWGGAVLNIAGSVTLTHTTISSNTVTAGSAGSPGGNAGSAGGGAVFNIQVGYPASLTLVSSALANTLGGFTDCMNLPPATTTSLGYNLVELDAPPPTNCLAFMPPVQPGDMTGVDPLLEPLADNGGPTWTHALKPGTPLLDHVLPGVNGCGIPPLHIDQRGAGFGRPMGGGCDTGAYENQYPTDITLNPSSVAENQPAGTNVGQLGDDDPDNTSNTFSLVAGAGDTDNASFTIVVAYLQTAASFDFETKSSYAVRVQTSDGLGGVAAKPFTVTVTNVNEPPTDIGLNPSSLPEQQPAGTLVGTLNTVDPDAGETYTYTLVAGAGSTDNASFGIAGSQLLTAAVLDYETQPTYTVRVQVDDDGGGTLEKPFTVAVTDVNEAPAFVTTPVISATIGFTYTYAFTASDMDAGNTLAFSAPGLPAWLALADHLDGSGMLTGTPALSNNGPHAVQLVATDNTGLTGTQSFTLTVRFLGVYAPLVIRAS